MITTRITMTTQNSISFHAQISVVKTFLTKDPTRSMNSPSNLFLPWKGRAAAVKRCSSDHPSSRGLLVVVVEVELVRMRAQTELFYLVLRLVGDPLLHEVVGEDVALGQERMVLTERFKRFLE